MPGSRGAHRHYVPPRRLDQSPRYKGFSPREFLYAMGAVFVVLVSTVFLPMAHIPWDLTFPFALPIAFLVFIWPRKIRDRQWEEGQLIQIRLRKLRTKGRRFAV